MTTGARDGARRVVGSAVILALWGLVGLTAVVDWPHTAVLAGLCLAALWAIPALRVCGVGADWTAESATFVRAGVRSEVAWLGWRLEGRDGTVGEQALTRARAVAAVRLGARGVVWDDLVDGEPAARAAASALVGPAVAGALSRPGTRVTLAELTRWLAALDALGPPPSTHHHEEGNHHVRQP